MRILKRLISGFIMLILLASQVFAAANGKIRGSNVNLRQGPGTNYPSSGTLPVNTDVIILGETEGADGKTWAQVSSSYGQGYIRSDYIKKQVSYVYDAQFEVSLSQQGFPESYKESLRQLHQMYPNWVFKAQNTGYDWNTAVYTELSGSQSLVESSSKSSWKSTESGKFNYLTSSWPGFDGASWVAASKEIVEYYMDPRNFLDDRYIFQFVENGYDPVTQTRDGVLQMVNGTFLSGNVTVGSESQIYQNYYQAAVNSIINSASGNETSDPASDASDTSNTSVTDTFSTDSLSPANDIEESEAVYEGPVGNILGDFEATSPADVLNDLSSDIKMDLTGSIPMPGTASLSGSYGPGSGNSSNSLTVTDSVDISTLQQGYLNVPYADVIMEASTLTNLSPYLLASMIIQEQGKKGSGGSISGASGYYNYFNVGAYQADGMTAVERGIWFASQQGSYNRPWNTPEKAIIGGAMFYAENYLSAGQDTLYLKKFNVQGQNAFKHQYMTNVPGGAEEGALLVPAYENSMSVLPIEFKIPIYLNMPDSCPMPEGDGNPNNKLQSLTVEGFNITPTFNMDTENYTLIVDPSVQAVNVSAVPIHSKATLAGTGTVYLSGTSTTLPVYVTAENGSVRTYSIVINRQDGGAVSMYSNVSLSTISDQSTVTDNNSSDSQGPVLDAQSFEGQVFAAPETNETESVSADGEVISSLGPLSQFSVEAPK